MPQRPKKHKSIPKNLKHVEKTSEKSNLFPAATEPPASAAAAAAAVAAAVAAAAAAAAAAVAANIFEVKY